MQSYNGAIPFAVFLKQFFRENKKYGSRDRKVIADLCYSFFRIGKSFSDQKMEQRILLGTFLTHNISHEILKRFNPNWNELISLPVSEKLKYLEAENEWRNLFPFITSISSELDLQNFAYSVVQQPDLFLRIRPGNKEIVLNKLCAAEVEFKVINDSCIVIPNATKVDAILDLDREAVVQDHNSQQTVAIYKSEIENLPAGRHGLKSKTAVWDCCAGSGGKSILLYDLFNGVQLTVSDVREKILYNLHARFKTAGIQNYNTLLANLALPDFQLPTSGFELILCDAPCSGSGTWGRTPEQLYFFDEKKIEHYSALQKNIVLNASRSLKKNGFFLYITCSVFRKENEDVVNFIQDNTKLKLKKMDYLMGYDRKADTLFSALFTMS